MPDYGDVKRNPPSGRMAGIVMHPTSLDGAYGTGDLGAACYEFVDWLASAGMKAWQARTSPSCLPLILHSLGPRSDEFKAVPKPLAQAHMLLSSASHGDAVQHCAVWCRLRSQLQNGCSVGM